MKRDRKLAQKKKARDKARVTARTTGAFSSAMAAASPFGPCWLSRSWRDESLPPALVSVIITRALGRLYVAHMMLIDRTCLGVKSAMTVGPLTAAELAKQMERVAQTHVDGMEAVDAETAQSVVFAAVAYAARLGFRPDGDFDARLVGPAPSPLRPTPLAALERPFYMPGLDENHEQVLATLRRAVGAEGFDVASHDDEDLDDEDLDDEDLDELARDGAKSEDEEALADAFDLARETMAPERTREWKRAGEELLIAFDVARELPPEHRTSLLPFWATLFRPSADGDRGVDVMRKRRPRDPAFARARADARRALRDPVRDREHRLMP